MIKKNTKSLSNSNLSTVEKLNVLLIDSLIDIKNSTNFIYWQYQITFQTEKRTIIKYENFSDIFNETNKMLEVIKEIEPETQQLEKITKIQSYLNEDKDILTIEFFIEDKKLYKVSLEEKI